MVAAQMRHERLVLKDHIGLNPYHDGGEAYASTTNSNGRRGSVIRMGWQTGRGGAGRHWRTFGLGELYHSLALTLRSARRPHIVGLPIDADRARREGVVSVCCGPHAWLNVG